MTIAPSAQKRFFIALLPPTAIQQEANVIKQYFAERYGSRAAQKSPPHITLQPPFEWAEADLPKLEHCLSEFASTQDAIALTLDGFAAFPPRVIFIHVVKTPALLFLQSALMDWVETTLGIVDLKSKTRPFAPHLTVAFRDLTRSNFKLAWQEFQYRSFYGEFIASALSLLIHDGKCWIVHREFPFASSP